MNYESRKTFPSTSLAGVSFTLLKINVRRRLAFNLLMAKKFEALREIYKRRKPFDDEYRAVIKAAREKARPEIEALMEAESISREEATKKAKVTLEFPEDKLEQMLTITNEAQEYDARECTPDMVKFFLQKIEGLEIDGAPATADSLIDSGPDDLYQEVAQAISGQLGLTNTEKENLTLAGTSEPPAGGPANPEPAASPTIVETVTSAATT
jgi:hypothetical protein